MSNLLDQLLMEDIAKYCPQNFISFHKCISENHSNPENCNKEQFELSKCIKNEVPSLKLILKNCSNLLNDYQSCIMKGELSNCQDKLDKVKDCASQYVQNDSGKLNKL
ncbi:hypothetical protein WICMUC_003852 [Wickerhamomyces mucosus]|uniref:IMS import disulfide relay-system CHCH-CHCH-like Cx9C domain-containing protein n=1 Tax=Wickerhamomyces mucosus TaxID=1378264 RepID=A0A9P8PJ05_9ASCO|nr:hypothetical protein WICMUC_003852 [Wickerhamomyces mucosus]